MEIFSVHCTVLLVLACYIKVTFQFNINHVNVDTDVPLQPFHYTASVLRSLKPVDLSCYKPTVPLPPEVTVPRKRGRRGGVKNRLKKKRNRIPLPIVITGNARSLNNKVDELSACVRHYSEYRNASLIAFSETWFNNKSTSIDIDNFKCVRGDRTDAALKDGGGGVCLYVNNRYCHPNNVYTTGHICTPDVEILTVTLRPYYLPREFPKVTVNIVYVPCSAHDETAAEIIAETVNQQQTSTPDGVVLLTGDFNTCRIESHLPQFEQCVTGPTREGNTLDTFYVIF